VDGAQDLPTIDGLLFTTKGPQLAAAVGQVASSLTGGSPLSWAAGFQNGVSKDEVLAAAFGEARVVAAATVLNARRTGAGQVSVGSLGMSYFGELSGGLSDRVRSVCDVFIEAGLPATPVTDGRSLVWTKFANAVGIFAVTSLSRLSTPEMFHRPPFASAYRSLIEEVEAVAQAEGVAVADYPGLPVRTYLDMPASEFASLMAARPYDPSGPPNFSSMLQDLTAGRKTEAEQIFGDLARRGRQHGVLTPLTDFVKALIDGLEWES
jgi:2-dehydropantoate 2-reductase